MTVEDIHHSVESERRARNLEAVLQYSRMLSSSLNLEFALNSTCQAIVELFNVSHSSFILPSSDHMTGKVCAEFPEIGARGLMIRLGEKEEEKRLSTIKNPLFIEDARGASELSRIRDALLGLNIHSILIVPVTSNEQTLGYFTLDTIGYSRAYTPDEIELCKVFAAQAAVAIKNAQLYEETNRRAEQLEALRRTTLAITSKLERDSLLDEIVEQAVGLLKAENGGVFEYDPFRREMMVIIDSSYGAAKRGVTLCPGQGMAGRLIESSEPYMIVDHYEEWSERAPVGVGRRPSGAVLEVKIMWQGQLNGTLFVEDRVPRKFTEGDARLLMLFADHAAIAMNNAKLVRELREGQDNLANLNWAARSLSGQIDPVQVLQMIAELVMKSLEGDSATIWPFDKWQDNFLVSDVVTVGISGAELQEFKSQVPPPGGISRSIIREGWVGVEDVEADDFDFLINSPRRELLLRMKIKSFQGIILKVDNEPVGVMYVNYNERHRFDYRDRRHMESLATNAALALVIVRNARLFMEQDLAVLSRYFLTPLDRQEILNRSVKAGRKLLRADRCSIVLLEPTDKLFIVAEDGAQDVRTGMMEIERGRHSQTGYTIETGESKRVYDYEAETEFTRSEPVLEKGLKSGMSVPMLSGPTTIGAMLVHSRGQRNFTPAEEETLKVIANQAASAIERCDEITRNSAYLSALYKASKAILEESGKAIYEKRFERKGILKEIAKQAVMCLVDSHGPKATMGTLQSYDEEVKELSLESVYSPDKETEVRAKFSQKRSLMGVPDHKLGYAGLTALKGEPLLIPDVRNGELKNFYYEFLESTRSELTVPMIHRGKVIGVLNVESDRLGAFDETDLQELQLLADFAVIAISNADQYEELRETDKRVNANESVAFMGMASSIWGHSIRGYTINIRELVRTMRADLKRTLLLPRKRDLLNDKLERIERLSTQILERPIIEPLGSDRGVAILPIRTLIEERVKQMRRADPHGSTRIKLNFPSDDRAFVQGHPQWLRRALDIILDNAVEAMKKVEPARRSLNISTAIVGNRVEVAITDSGPGIKPELRDKVLREHLKKDPGEGGAGLGLLMAQAIINAYGGEIQVGSSSEQGTTMIISLPISNQS